MSVFADSICSVIEKYGQSLSLVGSSGEKLSVKAFIQPITTRNKRFYESQQTPLGAVAIGRYVYIGLPGTDPMDYDYIIWGGRRFIPATSEAVAVGGADTHIWAVLRYDGQAEAGEVSG